MEQYLAANPDAPVVRRYHDLLAWQITERPAWLDGLERGVLRVVRPGATDRGRLGQCRFAGEHGFEVERLRSRSARPRSDRARSVGRDRVRHQGKGRPVRIGGSWQDVTAQRAAERVAMQVAACLAEPFEVAGAEFQISASTGIAAAPRDARIASSIRKSPTARGTRSPDATVCASCHGSACDAPDSHAFTIGAHPSACTDTIRGRSGPMKRRDPPTSPPTRLQRPTDTPPST